MVRPLESGSFDNKDILVPGTGGMVGNPIPHFRYCQSEGFTISCRHLGRPFRLYLQLELDSAERRTRG